MCIMMDKIRIKIQSSSVLGVFVLLACMAFASVAGAQSGLYVPSAKPVRNMQKALTNPETFYLVLHHNASQNAYSTPDLDLLDSAYRIAFDVENPMYYTMTIEGYGGSNEAVTRQRVDAVYRYFAMRCRANFPIRYAKNPIHCSCNGDTTEVLRFEVPVITAVYKYSELPEARRVGWLCAGYLPQQPRRVCRQRPRLFRTRARHAGARLLCLHAPQQRVALCGAEHQGYLSYRLFGED